MTTEATDHKAMKPRPSRQLWVSLGGSVREEVGYECTGYDPPMYWFPELGEPGWGTSMTIGSGCFETREDAIAAATAYLDNLTDSVERKRANLLDRPK